MMPLLKYEARCALPCPVILTASVKGLAMSRISFNVPSAFEPVTGITLYWTVSPG